MLFVNCGKKEKCKHHGSWACKTCIRNTLVKDRFEPKEVDFKNIFEKVKGAD